MTGEQLDLLDLLPPVCGYCRSDDVAGWLETTKGGHMPLCRRYWCQRYFAHAWMPSMPRDENDTEHPGYAYLDAGVAMWFTLR